MATEINVEAVKQRRAQKRRERLAAAMDAAPSQPEVQAQETPQAAPVEAVPPVRDRDRMLKRLKATDTPVEEFRVREPTNIQEPKQRAPQMPLATDHIPFTTAEVDQIGGLGHVMTADKQVGFKQVADRAAKAAEAAQKGATNAKAAIMSLAPLAFPAHATQAVLMGRPDMIKQAWTMDRHWGTAEGEAALASWPSPTEIARRTRAHLRARARIMQKAQDRGDIGQGDDFFTAGNFLTYEHLAEEYERVREDEEREWFRVNLNGGHDPSKLVSENIEEYLAAGGDPQVVERVQKLNEIAFKENGTADMSGLDLVVDRGLPFMGLAVGLEMVDPLLPIGATKARHVRMLTEMDEFRRVGLLPSLARERKLVGKAKAGLKDMDAQPLSGLIAAEKRIEAAQELGISPHLAEDAEMMLDGERAVVSSVRARIEDELGMTAFDNDMPDLTVDDEYIELVDWAMAGMRHDVKPENYRKGLIKRLESDFEGAPQGWAEQRADAIMHHVEPLRALRSFISEDQALRAARTIPARRAATQEALLKANANVDAIEQEALRQANGLITGEMTLKDLNHVMQSRHIQKFVDGFTTPNRGTQRNIQQLTGFEWDGMGWTREGMAALGHHREPRDMLHHTGVWEAIREGSRNGKVWVQGWGQRITNDFADLQVGSELDQKLGKALDAQLVDAAEDGSMRMRYEVIDPDDGHAVHTEIIELTAEEAAHYDQARAIWDELADDATARGLEGFGRGKPVIQDYFPRVHDFKRAKGETYREIPMELVDHVDNRIYFRHLQDRKYAQRLASAQTPLLSEGLELYLRGMARKSFMEPAIEQADIAAQALTDQKLEYWNEWKPLLKGQASPEGKVTERIIRRAMGEAARKMGKPLPRALANPLTATTTTLKRMWLRGILGASFGSMLTNMSQAINVGARDGLLNAMEGFTYMNTAKGRALRKELNLTDDFTAVMENDLSRTGSLPGKLGHAQVNLGRKMAAITNGEISKLDDIVMAPHMYAENTTRGLALWSGITRAMRNRGLAPGKFTFKGMKNVSNLDELPEDVRREILMEAMDGVEETMFIYGVEGTAPAHSGPVGRTLLTLSSFAPKQAAFLIRQAKQDPTGLARFFALSGFATRLSREAMGVDTESVWGFGFVPPETETFPLTSPQMQLLYNVWQYGNNNPEKGGDPFERQRALTNIVRMTGQLVPGPLGIRKEDIPQGVKNAFPALNQDIGSRAFRNTARLFRHAEDGVVRGRNETQLRPMGAQDQFIGAVGLQPESARRYRSLLEDIRGAERTTQLRSSNLQGQLAALIENGQDEAARDLLASRMNDGTITQAEMLRQGAFMRGLKRNVQGTNVDALHRILARSPGIGLRDDVKFLERSKQFQEREN